MLRRSQRVSALAFLFILLLAAAPAARAQGRADAVAFPFSPAPYRVGEQLTYTVSFSNFTTAAHVQLFVAGRGQYFGREGVELRAHVETIGIVSAALYSINNDYTTYVDPATGLPFRAQQVLREGTRVSDVTSDFNQPPAQTASSFAGYDLVSALYRLRALPLAPGATYTLSVQHGSSVYGAEVKVTGRELVKTNVGSANALVAQVRVPGHADINNYRLRIHFTDDERHVPLLITARLSAGEIRAELASAEMVAEPAPEAAVAATPPTARPTPGTNDARPGNTIKLPPQGGGTLSNPPPRGSAGGTAVTPRETPPAATPPATGLPFEVGEQLNFNFYVGAGAQAVGSAFFQVRARARYFNREGLLLTSVMQTVGAGQRLFPANDVISSYVDATSLLPFRTELRLVEGRRRDNWTVSVDQDRGTALFDDGTRVEIQAGTHDLVSIIYALRSFDITVGRRTAVSLLVNKRPRLLFITALRSDTIALAGQQIPATELALVTDDPQGDRLSLRLWVSNDRRRLPLRITANTPLGPVRGDLAIIPAQ